MAKGKKSIFFCQNCGHEEAKWLGQCPVCKEWNTFAEEKVSAGLSRGTTAAAKQSKTAEVVPLSQISARDDTRMLTGMKELDRVLYLLLLQTRVFSDLRLLSPRHWRS